MKQRGPHRLRHKLILVFLAATLLPLAAILRTSSTLMERSLSLVATDDTSRLSTSLETVAREFYQQARASVEADATTGRLEPERYDVATRATWPPALQQFWESPDRDRFALSEPDGDRLNYLVRRDSGIWRYVRPLGGVRMTDVTRQLQQARLRTENLSRRNLPRGFTLALLLVSVLVWTCSLALVVYLSHRISRPIQQLTAGLGDLAGGRFDTRIASGGRDEIGVAIEAFNHTAADLRQNRSRLVYLTQVASWQLLARKMAHELKNSLTPIRLTVEEIRARQPAADAAFLSRATEIVADEVASLERRVRAFSEFAAEPALEPVELDLNRLLEERIQFLRVGHPGVTYKVKAAAQLPRARADADQIKGILTNLLENAAEAAGPDGTVLGMTAARDAMVVVDVHDSGPGLTPEARSMLFEPSFSFKKQGMGLGLAISRKNALVAGGDLELVEGQLGGAGFRLLLPWVSS